MVRLVSSKTFVFGL